MKSKKEQQEQSVLLRTSGRSIGEIAEILSCSKASISVWTRGVTLDQSAVSRLRERSNSGRAKAGVSKSASAAKTRDVYRQEGRDRATHNNPLHLKGCMLYWAEGSKERSTLHFCNSNPEMIKLFIEFLFSLGVEKNKIVRKLFFYTDIHSEEKIEAYWDDVIGFDLKKLKNSINPYTEFSISSSKRKGKLPYGTCHLYVRDVKITQHIFGALEVYGNVFLNPKK